jgi:two-component system sensor histidine kinase DctS
VLLWSSLVLLLLIAQSWLVVLTIDFEANRVQDRADAAAIAAAAEVKSLGLQTIRLLQELSWVDGTAGPAADGGARELLRRHREIVRIEWRDAGLRMAAAMDTPYTPRWFEAIAREAIDFEAEVVCAAAARAASPLYSRSYFVPVAQGMARK